MTVVISFTIGLLLFGAVEFFYPHREEDEVSHRQKRFWATVMFVLGFVAGLLIEELSRLEDHISEVSSVFKSAVDNEVDGEFKSLYEAMSNELLHNDLRIRTWAIDNLRSTAESLREGYVPIPRRSVRREIGALYPQAREHVVATNVGDVQFFFSGSEGNQYINSNKALATARHIPVVRYYLVHYGHASPAAQKDTLDVIQKIHTDCHTLRSIVIDIDAVTGFTPRDVILFDDRIAAESDLSPRYHENLGARVTTNADRLESLRAYLYDLSLQPRVADYQSPQEIATSDFPQFVGLVNGGTDGGDFGLASAIYDRILREIAPRGARVIVDRDDQK